MKKTLLTITLLSGISTYHAMQSMNQAGPVQQAHQNATTTFVQNWMQQRNIQNNTDLTPEQFTQVTIAAEESAPVVILENAFVQEIIQRRIPNQQATAYIINTPNLFDAFKLAVKVLQPLEFFNIVRNNAQFAAMLPQSLIDGMNYLLNYRRNIQYRNNFSEINRNYSELLQYLQNNFSNELWAQTLITFLEEEINVYLHQIGPSQG